RDTYLQPVLRDRGNKTATERCKNPATKRTKPQRCSRAKCRFWVYPKDASEGLCSGGIGAVRDVSSAPISFEDASMIRGGLYFRDAGGAALADDPSLRPIL
ncbi:hypothetical protein ACFWQK_16065, partial [Brachybacterium paraconglomeratum]